MPQPSSKNVAALEEGKQHVEDAIRVFDGLGEAKFADALRALVEAGKIDSAVKLVARQVEPLKEWVRPMFRNPQSHLR